MTMMLKVKGGETFHGVVRVEETHTGSGKYEIELSSGKTHTLGGDIEILA